MTHDFQKRRGQRVRKNVFGVLQRGDAQGESFDESYAERPDVGSGRNRRGGVFRCVVDGFFYDCDARFADGRNRIAGKS